ncbi:acyl-CoA thioesterase [Nocardioides litoris]|uniref:acyl-CoA thioesterase n=1 Tax=Nocardioides litoris TaxID=1926648 RepID=UPI00111E208D|nr:thioesterase family protein [Nocardioides litoris]
MSTRPAAPTRAEFAAWRTATTRWSDDDVFGHMNNARYFDLMDVAVNVHMAEALGTDIRRLPVVGLVAEVSCRYFSEMGYPLDVELGLAVDRIGSSSIVYRIGMFQGAGPEADVARAEGRFVQVYVDNSAGRGAPRRSVPIPDDVRAAVTPLLRERPA